MVYLKEKKNKDNKQIKHSVINIILLANVEKDKLPKQTEIDIFHCKTTFETNKQKSIYFTMKLKHFPGQYFNRIVCKRKFIKWSAIN